MFQLYSTPSLHGTWTNQRRLTHNYFSPNCRSFLNLWQPTPALPDVLTSFRLFPHYPVTLICMPGLLLSNTYNSRIIPAVQPLKAPLQLRDHLYFLLVVFPLPRHLPPVFPLAYGTLFRSFSAPTPLLNRI